MKKTVRAFVALICIASLFLSAVAATPAEETTITYFSDGSYLVTTVSTNASSRAASTISGSKITNLYNGSDELQWTYTLYASFLYDGSTSECYSASCDIRIFNDDWQCASKSATFNVNTAIGRVSMDRYLLGVKVDERSTTITLTCDTNGNLT